MKTINKLNLKVQKETGDSSAVSKDNIKVMCKTEYSVKMEDSAEVKQEIVDPLDIKIEDCDLREFKSEFEIKNKNNEKCDTFENVYLHECNNHSNKFKCNLYSYNTDPLETHKLLKYDHNEANDQNTFKCAHCDYSSKLESNLKRYSLAKHTEANDLNAFKCAHCDYSSKCKSFLKTHILVKHTGAKDLNLNTFNYDDEYLSVADKNKQLSQATSNLKKLKRRRHNCIYCNKFVTNFSRHLERHHRDEIQVRHFLYFNKSDIRRKNIINKLRKEGDFCTGEIIPVQKRIHISNTDNTNSCKLLPCIYCKGYYSRISLRRHVQRCIYNKDKKATRSRKQHQSQSHTLMAENFKINDPLRKSGLLNSLNPDEVSLVAKRDTVICEVGRRYIKCHKEKQLIKVAKRYMRLLARVLIEVRKMEHNNSLTFFSLLDPLKFKTVIQATKNIPQYDNNKRKFNSPSLELQMRTIIKKGIAAAYSMEAQRDVNSPKLNILNNFERLIEDEWTIEILTEATQQKPLNISRINKPTVIPMAQDLLKLKNYLDTLISESITNLTADNKNEKAYKNLVEGTYCSLFLFNKRRAGELQKILLDKYQKDLNNSSSTEFEILLTISEKILLQTLNHIVIHGKRGREVPVIFDKLTQEGIDCAIEHRNNFLDMPNPYLFALQYSNSSISGYHVLRKHVNNALGDSHKIYSLTSTKHRKHLVTISQILKMEPEELELLATFLGHSIKIHREWYELPTNIYKTAKVSKLIIFAQNGFIDQYKGCQLDEIDLDDAIIETQDDSDEEVPGVNYNVDEIENVLENVNLEKNKVCTKKKILRKAWTEKEKRVTTDFFKKHIKNKVSPKKGEVTKFMENHPDLFQNKKWDVVKAYVYNQYREQDSGNRVIQKQPHSDEKVPVVHDNVIEMVKVQKSENLENDQVCTKKKIWRKAWTEKEKKITEDFFKIHIKNKVSPKKKEVTKFMENHPDLFQNKKWDVVKAYVYNQYREK